MKAEDQRIAIAEACGIQVRYFKAKYNNHGAPDYHVTATRKEAEEFPFHELGIEEFNHLGILPNYLNSLDAMHEAEKVLTTRAQQVDYWETLRGIVAATDQRWAFMATATQRAEAFLRTLNLWQPPSATPERE